MSLDELQWRILIQVLASQIVIMESDPNAEDRKKWIPIIWNQLLTINSKAQTFNPSNLPSGLPLCNALIADGRYYEQLTGKLTNLFCGAPTANTTRTET